MAVKIGHASISEKGSISGAAGDQTGREVCMRSWYRHSKGWVTLRCLVPGMSAYIAEAMERACNNPDIGYDQYQNQTLWNEVRDKDFDPAATAKKVETDCARLIRVCVQYALVKMGIGKTAPDFNTATLANALVRTGWFEKLTADKYNAQDDYLLRGDIQVTCTKGHTWCILSNGSKAGAAPMPEKPLPLGGRLLHNGSKGADVKELQSLLIQLDYDLGHWGADGEFGDATEMAVRAFQADSGLETDGVVGEKTLAALEKALEDGEPAQPQYVMISGGNCYIRSRPDTSGSILGVARAGEKLEYLGETSESGWHKVRRGDAEGYVSGKYGKKTGDQ